MIAYRQFDAVKTKEALRKKIMDVYERHIGQPCQSCGAKESSVRMVSSPTGRGDEIGTVFIVNCPACWNVFKHKHGLNQSDTEQWIYMDRRD